MAGRPAAVHGALLEPAGGMAIHISAYAAPRHARRLEPAEGLRALFLSAAFSPDQSIELPEFRCAPRRAAREIKRCRGFLQNLR